MEENHQSTTLGTFSYVHVSDWKEVILELWTAAKDIGSSLK